MKRDTNLVYIHYQSGFLLTILIATLSQLYLNLCEHFNHISLFRKEKKKLICICINDE